MWAKISVTAILLLTMSTFAITDAFLLVPKNPWGTVQIGATSSNAPTGDTIEDKAAQVQLAVVPTNEEAIIDLLKSPEAVIKNVILAQNDRIGTVSYIESPSTEVYFLALKEALLQNFTKQVTDLKDTLDTNNSDETYNILTFLDPGISTDRLYFIRFKNRLYEVHSPISSESALLAFINVLKE